MFSKAWLILLGRRGDTLIENLTVAAKDALELARQGAESRGHARVEPLHVFHALVFEPRGGVERIFRTLGIKRRDVRGEVEGLLSLMPFAAENAIRADSPGLVRAFELAAEEALHARYDRVDTDHLLFGLVLLGEPTLGR